MGKKIQTFLLMLFLSVGIGYAANGKFILVIDAGHGGHDTGARGSVSEEKDINLNVTLAFGRLVEQNCPDVKVVYTRKTDVFIPLHERANIANRNNANLFISIHTNAVAQGHEVQGFQTYTLGMHRAKDNLDVAMRENSVISLEKDYKQTYQGFDPKSSESYIMFEFMQSANMEKSVQLAKLIQSSVCNTANRIDKGVHQAGFLVLRETSMPSCLVELGFITTPAEEDFLNTSDGVESMAKGIYRAFVKYKNQYTNNIAMATGSSVQPVSTPKQSIPVTKPAPQKKTTKPAAQTTVVDKDTKKDFSKDKGKKKETEKKKDKAAKTAQTTAPSTKTTNKPTSITVDKSTPKKENTTVTPKKDNKKAATPKATVAEKKPTATSTAVKGKKETEAKKATEEKKFGADEIVFKVQVLATNSELKKGDDRLKGHTDLSSHKDGTYYKYMYGATTDYKQALALRKQLQTDFPGAFIVAYRNGKRIDTAEAIRQYNSSLKKK